MWRPHASVYRGSAVGFDPIHVERLIHDDAALEALGLAERASREAPADPEVRAYLGYLIAAERGQVRQGVELCEAALAASPHPCSVELNAARTYVKAGRKADAMRCLQAGLALAPADAALAAELRRLGVRLPPVLAWLPRSSGLNRLLGLLAARLRLRG